MEAAYNPHGTALLDCYRGDTAATLIVHQDGARDDVPALCRGRILDVGAGAGVHALELQRRGFEVTAIDVAPECVTIMRERGVQRALAVDAFDLEDGLFDTVILLCNGLDKVGRFADLPRFLDRMGTLLAPGGQLLADSFDLRVGASETAAAEIARKEASGRYFGESDLQFEYKGQRGEPFTVLQVDYATFADVATQAGWTCERVQEVGGHYLVRAYPTRVPGAR